MIRSIYSSRLRRRLQLIFAGRCALKIALIRHLTGEGVTLISADKSQATVWCTREKVRRFEPSTQYVLGDILRTALTCAHVGIAGMFGGPTDSDASTLMVYICSSDIAFLSLG